MAVDIASGLAYLAEMKFVHRYVECFTFPVQPGMNIVSLTCNVFVTWAHITLESYHFLSFKLNSLVRTCQKGDEWFPSQETTDSSDLLALAEWISIWRCTLVYTLLQSPPASAIIVSVMFGVLLDTVWFGVATVLMVSIKVTFSFLFRE